MEKMSPLIEEVETILEEKIKKSGFSLVMVPPPSTEHIFFALIHEFIEKLWLIPVKSTNKLLNDSNAFTYTLEFFVKGPTSLNWQGAIITIFCHTQHEFMNEYQLENLLNAIQQQRPVLNDLLITTNAIVSKNEREFIRKKSFETKINIDIYDWDDITQKLNKFPEILQKYYQEFFPQINNELYRSAFRLGTLIGGLLGQRFNLVYFALTGKETHQAKSKLTLKPQDLDSFLQQIAEEGSFLNIAKETEELIKIFRGATYLHDFYSSAYPRFQELLFQTSGEEVQRYFELAMVLQDAIIAVSELLQTNTDTMKKELLRILLKVKNYRIRAEKIITGVKLPQNIVRGILIMFDLIRDSEYQSVDEVQALLEKLHETIDIVYLTF
jgi:uncharacterized protein YcgL (UPF0745 family)